MNEIISIITLPVLSGLLLFLVPEKFRTIKGIVALLISIITGYLTIVIFIVPIIRYCFLMNYQPVQACLFQVLIFSSDAGRYLSFNSDNLSKLIILFVSLFTFLILLYSIVYIKAGRVKNYYPYFLITLGCSYGAVLSDNLLLFLAFWGVLGITLYKLIHGHDEESSATAKKTLILIGASDSIMIIGIAIIWKITGSLSMRGISVPTTNALSVIAFLALLIRQFHKSRCFSVSYLGSRLCKECSGLFIRLPSCFP